jgi:serine/threonine protein kinase
MLSMAEQIADVLVAAHEKGVIHRDLKPENIMVTGSGEVKVLDLASAPRRGGSPPRGPAGSSARQLGAPTRQLRSNPDDRACARRAPRASERHPSWRRHPVHRPPGSARSWGPWCLSPSRPGRAGLCERRMRWSAPAGDVHGRGPRPRKTQASASLSSPGKPPRRRLNKMTPSSCA